MIICRRTFFQLSRGKRFLRLHCQFLHNLNKTTACPIVFPPYVFSFMDFSTMHLVYWGIPFAQAIAQVRTVYSFVGESKALNSYSEAIQNTLKLGYKAGMAKGLGIGCTYGIACMSWALVFWYAGVFIRNGQTDGGKAFTAIFSAIVGGL